MDDVSTDQQHCSACGGILAMEDMAVVCNGRTEHARCHRMHARQSHPTPRQYDPVMLAVARELCLEEHQPWGFDDNEEMIAAAIAGQRMLTEAREDHSHCIESFEALVSKGVNGYLAHGLDAHLPRDRFLWL